MWDGYYSGLSPNFTVGSLVLELDLSFALLDSKNCWERDGVKITPSELLVFKTFFYDLFRY
jgi:hypothetical protein